MMVDSIENYRKYLLSAENLHHCKPFKLECERISKIAIEYSLVCDDIYEELNSNVTRYEYSTGGKTIHRGYYCPSPVLDIIVGGCNRGKLLKRLTSKSKPTYKYGFNDQNQLIISNYIHLNLNEIIIHKKNSTTGIVFSKDFGINTISECVYHDGRIASYICCLYFADEKSVTEYKKEEYGYSSNGLEYVDTYTFLNSKDTPILSRDRYQFMHDSNGYLSQYNVTEYEGEKAKEPYGEDFVYDVRILRKV
jgi:hypothetical protein